MRRTCPPYLTAVGIALLTLCIPDLSGARTIQKDTLGVYDLKNESHRYSIRLQSGLLTGTANEIVYAAGDSDELLSKLTWEIDEQYMIGLGASVQKEWVALHADAWFAATEGNGTMDDYDWLMPGPGWSDWSHHDDTKLSEAYAFDVNFEFLIPKISTDHFLISAFIGYKREHFEWEARGGSFIYSNETWRDTVGQFPPGMRGITYGQTFDAPYVALGLRGNFGKFELNGRLAATTLAAVEAQDTHHLRSLKTEAKLKDGDMVSVELAGTYSFTKHIALEIAYFHTEYDTMRGDVRYEWAETFAATFANGEGADLKTDMFSIILAYSF